MPSIKIALTTKTVGESKNTCGSKLPLQDRNLSSDLTLFAVRPAPEQGDTTQLCF